MKKLTIYLILAIALISCKKQEEWLDIKSNKSDIVPSTLKDYQAILDNNTIMNNGYPAIGIIGSDNSYVTDVNALTRGAISERNAYKWAADIYEGNASINSDWDNPYEKIEYANIVLDGLKKIVPSTEDQSQYNNVKGSAYFYRGLAYYHLAQLFCKPFIANSAKLDPGLILKLNSDVNDNPERSTVEETYKQILSDLESAVNLLPQIPLYKTRPSTVSAQMMLAKTYLHMGDYLQAETYAGKVLVTNNTLIDLTTLSPTPTYPFPNYQANNVEVVFYNICSGYTFNGVPEMLVVPELYNMYNNNDLRKTLFFRINADGTISFRGRYGGNLSIFCGLSVNEAFLIRAECFARRGKFTEAMSDLNTLLSKRWKKDGSGNSTYVPQTVLNETQALTIILDEKRKELPFTGNIRWEELRRLNLDSRFAKTLTRTIAGQTYSIAPNSPRYVFPIPPSQMTIRPVTQNPR